MTDDARTVPAAPPLDRAAAWRVLTHLLAQARGVFPGGPPPAAALTPERRLDEADLGADSLGRLQLAGQVAETFDLRRLGREDLLLARRRVKDWLDLAAESWAAGPAQVTFHTSGSQGAPQRVSHPVARLWAEACVLARDLADRRRVVALVPAHHIYGFLWTVLLPARLDVPVLDLAGADPTGLAGHLGPGDLVAGVPAQWRYLAAAPAWAPADAVAVSSAGPLPPETARALTQDAGFARAIEVFGSTETGGLGWRSDPEAAFRLLDTWQPKTAADNTLRRADDGSTAAPPDRLDWLDARHFLPVGRRDRAVTIGGVTVHPQAVARKLAARPGVAKARVRPAEGRLKALAVPQPGQDGPELAEALRSWAQTALPPAERPLRIQTAARIPTDALGKETDWDDAGD